MFKCAYLPIIMAAMISLVGCGGSSEESTSETSFYRSQTGRSLIGMPRGAGVCVVALDELNRLELVTKSPISVPGLKRALRVQSHWANIGWTSLGFLAGGMVATVWGGGAGTIPMVMLGGAVANTMSAVAQGEDATALVVAGSGIIPLFPYRFLIPQIPSILIGETLVREVRQNNFLSRGAFTISEQRFQKTINLMGMEPPMPGTCMGTEERVLQYVRGGI